MKKYCFLMFILFLPSYANKASQAKPIDKDKIEDIKWERLKEDMKIKASEKEHNENRETSFDILTKHRR